MAIYVKGKHLCKQKNSVLKFKNKNKKVMIKINSQKHEKK